MMLENQETTIICEVVVIIIIIYNIYKCLISLLMNWALAADIVYVKKKKYVKNSFTNVGNDDISWVRYLTDVKSAGFLSQLEASRVSNYIYIYIYIYIVNLTKGLLNEK